jgi:hypothetical protein
MTDKQRRLIVGVLTIPALLLCTEDYNPYEDYQNARVHVAESTSLTSGDTIEIFSTKNLPVFITLYDKIRQFWLVTSNNRDGDTISMTPGSTADYEFHLSYFDTGMKQISFITHRANGDLFTQENVMTIFVRSPLKQNHIIGTIGSPCTLSTPKVNDADVTYHWSFGPTVEISSRNSDTIAILRGLAGSETVNMGKLWVSDTLGKNLSPATPFFYQLGDSAIIRTLFPQTEIVVTQIDTLPFWLRINNKPNQIVVMSQIVNGALKIQDTVTAPKDTLYWSVKLTKGQNIIQAIASVGAAHVDSVTIQATYTPPPQDTTKPVISQISVNQLPVKTYTTTDTTADISVTAFGRAAGLATISANGKELVRDLLSNTWKISLFPLNHGNNRIAITAIDSAGNSISDSIAIVSNTIPGIVRPAVFPISFIAYKTYTDTITVADKNKSDSVRFTITKEPANSMDLRPLTSTSWLYNYAPTSRDTGIHIMTLTIGDQYNDTTFSWIYSVKPVNNLLTNGDFSNGTASWTSKFAAPASGTVSFNTNAATFEITTAGTENWHVQFYQVIQVTAGTVYHYSFSARTLTATPRDINFVVETSVNPYDKDVYLPIRIDQNVQTYENTFTALATRLVRIEIHAGLNTTEFEVDDFVVTKQ